MVDVDSVAKIATTVAVPVLTAIGIGGRRRRLRNEIKENLALVDEIEKHEILRDNTLASGWLQGRIAVDTAKLSGIKLGTPKSPVPKGSVVFAAVLFIGFGLWTYAIDASGFIWYSVFPAVVSLLMLISIFGMFTNRELPPNEADLPPGAVLAPTDTAQERVATLVAAAASGGMDNRALPGGQVDVALNFVRLAQSGAYEAALAFADENWLRCRVQAWLWNNRNHYGDDLSELDRLCDDMIERRAENEVWQIFVAMESQQFVSVWNSINVDRLGFAGRRRRLAGDIDLVILLPVGERGGYFVVSATAVPNALTFVVRKTDSGWKISNHLGTAPPIPGWPPLWWQANDPAIDALPDP